MDTAPQTPPDTSPVPTSLGKQPRYSALGVDGEETTGSATALHKVLGDLAELNLDFFSYQIWNPQKFKA